MNQSQQMRQQTTLAPALQRSLQLLQMNALEFSQEISESLDSNPLLERIDDADGQAVADADVEGHAADEGLGAVEFDGAQSASAPSDEVYEGRGDESPGESDGAGTFESDFANFGDSNPRSAGSGDGISALDLSASPVSLRQHLLQQLGSLPLEPLDGALAALVVDSLDEHGYLAESEVELLAMARSLAQGSDAVEPLDFGAADIDIAIRRVQSLEPTGVAARTITECLSLQLDDLRASVPGRALAAVIVTEHLDLLGAGDFRALAQATGADHEALSAAVRLIRTLDPKPGVAFSSERIDYAIPEVVVRRVGRRWEVRLHPAATPRLRINRTYADVAAQPSQSPALAEQLNQARWLLKSIEQRASTIERVAAAIVKRQQRYFDHGDIGLQPMRLADVATDVGIHESTVSRVVNSKYLQCPRGLVSLKTFFTSHVETRAGNACSATAVKAMIRQLLATESAGDPLSDHRLAKLLEQRGIRIARRTVTKYRDAMGIEAVEMRRHAGPGDEAQAPAAPSAAPAAATSRSPGQATASARARNLPGSVTRSPVELRV